jgi:hypothetical protein
LARAFDWQSRGQGFDSLILHPEDQRVTMSKIVTLFFSARILPEERGKMRKRSGYSRSEWYIIMNVTRTIFETIQIDILWKRCQSPPVIKFT